MGCSSVRVLFFILEKKKNLLLLFLLVPLKLRKTDMEKK